MYKIICKMFIRNYWLLIMKLMIFNLCINRHHHRTGLAWLACNTSITTAHNICLIMEKVNVQRYTLSINDAIKALSSMKSREMHKSWTCLIGKSSIVVIESDYDELTWKNIWTDLKRHFDNDKPKNKNKITDSQKKFHKIMNWIHWKKLQKVIAELPKIIGKIGKMQKSNKFSAYFTPMQNSRPEDSSICESNLQEACFELAELIEDGINFMRVEASEILAFVITHSERICKPGIPPHLPIAYGLQGHSLPMKIMLKMLNDIHNEPKKVNAQVLCEVYDGQFHSIIVKDGNGKPLTRLQHMQNYFKEVMINYDRDELISKLLVYSDICEEDLNELSQTKFKNGSTKNMNNITLEMKESNEKSQQEEINNQENVHQN